MILEYGAILDAREKLGELSRFAFYQEDGSMGQPTRKVLKKVRPGVVDVLKKAKAADQAKAPSSGGEAPKQLSFHSTMRRWKEQVESGGEDSPEALGGFLHRHYGHMDWSHKDVTKVARKAHKADDDTARKAADHFMTLKKGKSAGAGR